uniref:Uncharacterized protein n=1 Tax=Cacopsylla melanoneura TaxID=428564 RepID=A0A8D9FJC2_9HEMI
MPSVSESSNTLENPCIAPSSPLLIPEHNCRAPQVSCTSSPVTIAIVLAQILCKTSPIPIGRTPGHLSKATPRRARIARILCQSTIPFAMKRIRDATDSLKLVL